HNSVAVTSDGNDTSVCQNIASIQLHGNVSGGSATGQWTSSGTGTFTPNDSTLNASYQPSASDVTTGIVTLILTSTHNCANTSDTMKIIISPTPTVNAGSDIVICSSTTTVTLNGTISGGTSTGVWATSGTGSFSPSSDSLHAIYTVSATDLSAGSVHLVLTSTGNGICGAVTDTLLVTITNSTMAFAGNDTSLCASNSSLVLAGSINGGTQGQWTSSGTGIFTPSNTALNATYTPSAADISNGTVTIKLTPTTGCQPKADSLILSLHQVALVNAGRDTSLCASNPSLLLAGTVTGGSAQGVWSSMGSGTFTPNNTTLNATYTPGTIDISNGSVHLILTSTGNGICGAVTDTLHLIMNPSPMAAFSVSSTCAGHSVTFTDSSKVSSGTITNYNWTFGDGGTSTVASPPAYTYSTSSTYTVVLQVKSDKGCISTTTKTVTIGQAVSAHYIPTGGTYNTNQGIDFTNQSTGATTYVWNFGDNTSSSSATDPIHSFNLPGNYVVTLISSNGMGCSDTSKHEFTINPNGYAVPTGFTPNGDGLNDYFYIRGGPFSEYELRVFNEWGQQIFMSNSQSDKWDGSFNGVVQPAGTYMYIFIGAEDTKSMKLSGEINIIR
ncbi:MAG TPA: PKD domain-containing protein, partial [Bacteroidia bacterium]